MPRVSLAAVSLALAVALAACDHTGTISTPHPTPTVAVNTDGPCGDGRVLRPGEQCP